MEDVIGLKVSSYSADDDSAGTLARTLGNILHSHQAILEAKLLFPFEQSFHPADLVGRRDDRVGTVSGSSDSIRQRAKATVLFFFFSFVFQASASKRTKAHDSECAFLDSKM